MKLTINPKEIYQSLKKIERVIPNKTSIQIFENFLFNVHENAMAVTGSDGEVMASIILPIVNSDGQFKFCVNAKKFSQAIGAIKDDTLEITLDDKNTMKCKHKKGVFKLPYENSTDYPMIATDTDDFKKTQVNSTDIKELIRNVSYATGDDALRPMFNGIYFDFTDKGLVGVGTDTKVLVKNEFNIGDVSAMDSFIMPMKGAGIAQSFLDSTTDAMIDIKNNGNVGVLRLPKCWSIVFRQINAKFPNYNAVIPPKNENEVHINRVDFLDSLTRALLFSPYQSNTIKLRFSQNKVELIAQDIDFNLSSTEEVTCDYTGEELEIGFNGNAMVAAINNLSTNEITFNLNGSNKATLMYPEEGNILTLIMPMMI